jgi:hypothetical protein
VLPENPALPAYTAVRDFLPILGNVVVRVATPPTNVAVPTDVLPFLNVTVPVGVPDDEETEAVNVTACPSAEGFGDAVSVTAVGIWVTT